MGTRARLDSKMESKGAEYLVLGRLLIEGIQAFPALPNQRDYDIIAAYPPANTSCRIQVKSRWATDSNRSFPMSKLDFDFAVLALLNRGIRYHRGTEVERREPEFFVIPINVASAAHRVGTMSVLRLRDIPSYHDYLDAWDRIREFLGAPPVVGSA